MALLINKKGNRKRKRQQTGEEGKVGYGSTIDLKLVRGLRYCYWRLGKGWAGFDRDMARDGQELDRG